MIGRVFDERYEIIRRLGSGGMADVYLAHDRHLDRQVALKVLHPRLAEDEQFIERFRREASHAAGLNHPNIVQIYDRGEAEGTYYIAMEYLEGRPLKDIIDAYAPLRPEHIVSIATQILEALRFAHRRDIIHRDIKPQNIMVDDEGRVKVTDFGIARAGSSSRMTDTGSIIGTAHYLSPEQASGGQVGEGSDLYSLGVVMYEMATGRLPFSGDNPVAIAMQHVNDAPVAPAELNPQLPENLERVILHALAKQPGQRYATADAALDDLRRVEGGHPVAPPPSFEEQTTRVMGMEAATQVMGGGAGAAAAGRTMIRPGPPRTRPIYEDYPHDGGGIALPAEERRSRVWPWLLVLLFVLLLGAAVYALLGQLQGPPLVEVPEIVGKSEQEARDLLAPLDLELEVTERRPDPEKPAGVVLVQDPLVGTRLPEGDSVKAVVSAGPELVEVPDVVGRTLEGAATALGIEGFEIEKEGEEFSEEFAEGQVTRQDPEGGQEAREGSVVRVWVSKGPEVKNVRVPDLIGLSREGAERLLENLNLKADVRAQPSDEPQGEVIGQEPAAGTSHPEGSTVVVIVSSGPEKVEVPAVVGKTQQEANTILGQAGLKVSAEPAASEAPAGTVIEQDPEAGEEVEPGATVTMIVSSGPPETTTTTAPTTTLPPSGSLDPPGRDRGRGSDRS